MKTKKFHEEETSLSPLMLGLVVLFVSCLIISNILANQMLQVWKWSLDAGTLLFPVTYILSDVFSEVYGYKWSRRVTWWAASMNVLFALLVALSSALPHPEWFDSSHFELALNSSFRIVAASVISYVVGDWVNDRIFRRLKSKHSGMEGFKVRAFLSSLCGQVVDSTLFVTIAFLFDMPISEIVPMIALNIVAKTGYEVIILPITYRVAQYIRQKECQYRGVQHHG